jgi:tRNA-2-methylthio-N6-dimethylallyladenosine synthase
MSLVDAAGFDDAYTFKYSVREGTPAERIKGHVADEVASERLARLIEVVRSQVRRRNMRRVGELHEALVERPARRGELMLARTRQNLLVLVDLPASDVGAYRMVRLSGTTGSTFIGGVEQPALAVL